MFDRWGYEVLHPWWLLLLPLIVVDIFIQTRRSAAARRYALEKAHAQVAPRYGTLRERLGQVRSRIRFVLPTVLKALTYASVVLSLAEITRGYVWTEEKLETPNVLLLVDSSASMFQSKTSYDASGMKPITCRSLEETEQYPRMKGMCRALRKFVDLSEEGVRRSVNLPPPQEGRPPELIERKKPLISLMAFARDPAVILFPTTDYRRLRDQIEHFEWSADLLGGDTNIHTAIYAALSNLVFRYASETNTPALSSATGSGQLFTEGEMKLLRKALQPQGGRSTVSGHFTPPPELNEKMINLRPRIQEWTMLILTDAVYDDLRSFEMLDPSFWKLLDLAAYLKLRIYFISTENFLARLKLAAQETGGDFFLIRKDDPLANMEQVVREIFEKHLHRTTSVRIQRRESYTWWCSLAGLVFFLSWMAAEYTFARSLTGEI